ncbi:hypothetical protein OHQ89_12135 [Streptomyces canus]|uniref:hypothetical protein n=1 Tax=Streptomyces canus TaxID=58343 RepID=UPI0030E0BDDE
MTASRKSSATLYDIASNTVWRQMSTAEAKREVQACHGLGDTVQEYDTADRDGNSMRVALQYDATGPHAGSDQGGVYVFPR